MLGDWTYQAVEELCAAGQSESDRHDFKLNLPDPLSLTKLCCAFANTSGGFVIVGVRDAVFGQFDPVGIDPDKELYGKFLAKVKADPDIAVSLPKTVLIPGSSKLLYILEILQSSRRPHLPTPADQRVFWKRQGSSCVQMTLEEVRYQMNSYEEKREKLSLLLIDLSHKLRALEEQATLADNHYTGDLFSFDIIDRVIAEAYPILKADLNTIGVLDTLKKRLSLLNVEKQKLFAILSQSYGQEHKYESANVYRELARAMRPEINVIVEQIERSFAEKFGIENPYKVRA